MNILLGSLLCMLGGLGVGTFLLPLKFSRRWKWENSWMVGIVVMYIIFPIVALHAVVPDFWEIYSKTPIGDLLMIFLFGLLQGTGAYVFTYGTTLMGLTLGYALMIGSISVVGLLVPLFGAHLDRIAKLDGITLMIGLVILLVGIAISALAGMRRDKERTDGKNASQSDSKKKAGILLLTAIVLWAGIANALYYFTFEFQQSMKAMAIEEYQVPEHFWGFLNIAPFFFGMFIVNAVMSVAKMIKDDSLKNFWSGEGLAREYFLAVLIGILWYLGQGVCYTAGHTMLGPLGVAVGAALFMGTMMVASNISGVRTGEWKGVSGTTMAILYTGLVLLIAAMSVIAVGNYLQEQIAG